MITRRCLVGMLGATVAAPAIVRFQSIMPIKAMPTILFDPTFATGNVTDTIVDTDAILRRFWSDYYRIVQ